MTKHRFSLPALSAVMLLAFAAPSFANSITAATGTVTCSGFTLDLSFTDIEDGLQESAATYSVTYSITLQPSIGPAVTLTGTTPIYSNAGNTTTPTQVFSVTFATPLTQSYTITGGTVQLYYGFQYNSPTPIPDVPTNGPFTISFGSTSVGPCSPVTISGCTVTQGGWGAPAHGNNPGTYLNAHFPLGGVTIGGSDYLIFNSAAAIRSFLPQGGPPSFLSADATNPTTSSAGVFAGQVLALKLNVSFYSVGSLVLHGTGTSLDGSTVSAVLAAANAALGGGTLPTGFTYSSLNDLIDSLNSSFDGCNEDGWAKLHLAAATPV